MYLNISCAQAIIHIRFYFQWSPEEILQKSIDRKLYSDGLVNVSAPWLRPN